MSYQNLIYSQITSPSTALNQNQNQNQIINKEEEFNYLDDLPDEEEEEEGPTEHTFNILSQIEFNEGRREGENALVNFDKQKRVKVIKQLKKKLDKIIKRFYLTPKTFKVKKSFCGMDDRDFYDKYILRDLSVKKTFAGFCKSNGRILRKLSRKVKHAEFEQLISTKIRTFFRPAAYAQE